MAYGFTQVYRVDYKKIFAPTICYDTFCIFFIIASKNNCKVHQVDNVTVF